MDNHCSTGQKVRTETQKKHNAEMNHKKQKRMTKTICSMNDLKFL